MPLNDWSDRIVIAELNDEPAFSEDIEALMRRLDRDKASMPDVIADFKAVTYLNSSNIAQLLMLRNKLKQSHRQFRGCSVSDAVWSVILTTGVDRLISFTEDVSTSLASLQIQGQQG
jgi:anti-anti-sigma factor